MSQLNNQNKSTKGGQPTGPKINDLVWFFVNFVLLLIVLHKNSLKKTIWSILKTDIFFIIWIDLFILDKKPPSIRKH